MMGRFRQQGFAIALVMWSIAGMSLMVTAVIHFTRDDLDLVEQRLAEAKTSALARGVPLLMIRDEQFMMQEGNEDLGGASLEYTFGDVSARVRELDASGLLSLTSATSDELALLLTSVAGIAEQEASALSDNLVEFRSSTPVIDPSQLLTVPGFTKQIFDQARPWVHAIGDGEWNLDATTSALRSSLIESGSIESSDEDPSFAGKGLSGGRGKGCTELTFECLDARDSSGVPFRLFEVDVMLPDGTTFSHWLWVSQQQGSVSTIDQATFRGYSRGA